nr:transposase [Gelidibacter gilvus]
MHHRQSIRLKGYDYSQAGLYFITLCCQDRIHRFGKVENNAMILNEFGIVAYNEWMHTPNIRKNITLGEFIIMPNHIHGIIRIMRMAESHSPGIMSNGEFHSSDNTFNSELHSGGNASNAELHSPRNVELNASDDRGVFKTPLRSPSQTIGAIVRGYKSSVTKKLGIMGFTDKLWQRNYYEHIIRNEQSYHTISEYIINNPAKWTDDKFYK